MNRTDYLVAAFITAGVAHNLMGSETKTYPPNGAAK